MAVDSQCLAYGVYCVRENFLQEVVVVAGFGDFPATQLAQL